MNQKIQIEKLGKERQRLTEKIKKMAERKRIVYLNQQIKKMSNINRILKENKILYLQKGRLKFQGKEVKVERRMFKTLRKIMKII